MRRTLIIILASFVFTNFTNIRRKSLYYIAKADNDDECWWRLIWPMNPFHSGGSLPPYRPKPPLLSRLQYTLPHTVPHTLPHTAALPTHCHTLPHTLPNTLPNTLPHAATHCHMLPHTATHSATYNTLSHTLPHSATHISTHCQTQRGVSRVGCLLQSHCTEGSEGGGVCLPPSSDLWLYVPWVHCCTPSLCYLMVIRETQIQTLSGWPTIALSAAC